MQSTLDALSRFCPSIATSGMIRWRAYRRISSGESAAAEARSPRRSKGEEFFVIGESTKVEDRSGEKLVHRDTPARHRGLRIGDLTSRVLLASLTLIVPSRRGSPNGH